MEITFTLIKPIRVLLVKLVVKILLLPTLRRMPNKWATGMLRGAFEFQGQKCSAASRSYIPQSLWPEIKAFMIAEMKTFKMGSPEDLSNFITAVIHEGSFDKLAGFIDRAKQDTGCNHPCWWKL